MKGWTGGWRDSGKDGWMGEPRDRWVDDRWMWMVGQTNEWINNDNDGSMDR